MYPFHQHQRQFSSVVVCNYSKKCFLEPNWWLQYSPLHGKCPYNCTRIEMLCATAWGGTQPHWHADAKWRASRWRATNHDDEGDDVHGKELVLRQGLVLRQHPLRCSEGPTCARCTTRSSAPPRARVRRHHPLRCSKGSACARCTSRSSAPPYSGQNIPERCWSGCAQRTFSQGQRRLKKIFNSCRPVLSYAL